MAQQPVITFNKTTHDFGKINEADGRVTTIFEFKNEGMSPLVLSNVRASCGCTTPKWTHEPIEPGQTGEITVTYNPSGRPGRFQKSITVTSNAVEPTTRLYIKGEVIPKPAQPVDKYPVKMGVLGLQKKNVNLGSVKRGAPKTVEIEYANNLIKSDDLKTMQQYFYSFWSSRSTLSPDVEWEKYFAQVQRVNASFSALKSKGYQTDRGRVFLKYGAPDRIVQNHNETGAYPYEIWHYYTLANQRNKKFVFMSRDIATNDFQLIHSDAIGELNNSRWTNEIYSRTYSTYQEFYNEDGTVNPDFYYGDDAKDYYDNPR